MNKLVTDLELSKKLYEAGIVTDAENCYITNVDFNKIDTDKYESIFEAVKYCNDNGITKTKVVPYVEMSDSKKRRLKYCPAPIAEELLELMPEMFIDELGYHKYLEVTKIFNKYYVKYGDIEESDTKLSNALGKMALWLKENGYLYE